MAVFLFIFIAILLFLKYADKQRFSQFLPLTITAVFVRFLEQFLAVYWFGFLKVLEDGSLKLWIPIFTDITIWPISAYLFIQYMPPRRRWLYAIAWSSGLILYLHMLKWVKVIHMQPEWYSFLTPVTVGAFFGTVYWVWRWLYPNVSQRQVTAHESS